MSNFELIFSMHVDIRRGDHGIKHESILKRSLETTGIIFKQILENLRELVIDMQLS